VPEAPTITRARRLWDAIPARVRTSVGVLAGLTLAAAALVFAGRGVDRDGLVAAFADVSWWWVAGAAVANVLTIVAQGHAWRLGLRAGGMGEVKARHAIAATWIGKAGNQVLPGKVGEVARVALIRSHLPADRREISRIVGSVVAQRVVLIVATFIVITLAATVLGMPAEIPGGRWAPPLALLVMGLAGVLASRRRAPGAERPTGRVRAVVARFAAGAGLLRMDRLAASALGLHLVGLSSQIAMMHFLMRGFGVSAPPTAALLVIALVGIAGAVPAVPGGAGLNQAALVAPLGAIYGVAPDTALAFSLGLQATLAGVAVAGGLVVAARYRGLRRATVLP
jgi:uncharacterized membrane protein YbhN (UPF0104 family)